MDVNSINNNINTLNNSSSLQLDRVGQSNQIEKKDNSELNLTINEYNKQRDELSIDVQSLNDGLAITKISQNAIDKQKEFLSNIQDKLSNVENYQDKNDIKAEVNQELRNFNQIAYETKFKNQNLLVTNEFDENPTFEVNTSKGNFTIEKANTAQIANDIFESVNNYDLNKSENLNASVTKIQSSYNQLQNTYEQFTELGNALETSAKETISEQRELYNNNVANKLRDFGKESSDFSKTNVSSNAGYLAASQSNIVQDQTVRLLS